MPRPLHAIIDPVAIAANLALARRRAPRARLFATVKANAYGHRLEHALPGLAAADGLAVCEVDVALQLSEAERAAGRSRPVLLLEGAFEVADLRACARAGVWMVVHSDEQVRMLECERSPRPVHVFAKMNSGMNRLGFAPQRFAREVDRLRALDRVASITCMTHFAGADEPEGIDQPLAVFEAHAGHADLPRSLANSAALLRDERARDGWARPGLMLYGASPFATVPAAALGLRPAMRLESALIAVQEVPAGGRVGYAGTFTAPQAMRVGIAACGYADGYPRHAPTGTPVLVDGVRTRTLGRVSMDMLAVDLSPVPSAVTGSPVTLWGGALPIEDVAAAAGTLAYELMCAVAPRVPVRSIGIDGGEN